MHWRLRSGRRRPRGGLRRPPGPPDISLPGATPRPARPVITPRPSPPCPFQRQLRLGLDGGDAVVVHGNAVHCHRIFLGRVGVQEDQRPLLHPFGPPVAGDAQDGLLRCQPPAQPVVQHLHRLRVRGVRRAVPAVVGIGPYPKTSSGILSARGPLPTPAAVSRRPRACISSLSTRIIAV